MAVRNHLSPARAYGAVAIAGIRFVPAATTAAIVKQESWGVANIVRNGTGSYTISLLGRPKGFIALVSHTENDITDYHATRVESQSDATYSVTVSHKSATFATIAAGPVASDVVDSITVLFFERAE